jgi:hypothetical protein
MRRVYFVLSILMLAAVVAQMYFAAVGAFAKPQTDSSYALHSVNGMLVLPLLSVLATVTAAIAKAPGRLIGLTILPLGLVLVQVLIIALGKAFNDGADNTTAVSIAVMGLHALNALAIGGVASSVLAGARRHLKAA